MANIRRSMLFIPGNNSGMLISSDVFDADSIIFDLEDSVALDEKDSARILVKEVLKTIHFKSEIIVRVNPFDTPYYALDVEEIKQSNIDLILLPKATVESVIDLSKRLEGTEIGIMVLIETAMGVEQVYNILDASNRCYGLMLGGEDLCVDLNCKRTKLGQELFYARGRVVNAAHALNKFVIDTPFTDIYDESGLEKDTLFAKSLGFDGKASINPRQIVSINQVFNPTIDEINHAKRIIEAKDRALKEGKGVFSLDGKMVDLPIIKRAEKIIEMASKIGLIKGVLL
ncbi:HpcH/HpaI aldolase/citrate lyase family protein [Mycoplasmatota bacterium]|nr:HpcH/HpaI aldolase/citrate lyase family protein [Mycoplasmatota bacterium]